MAIVRADLYSDALKRTVPITAVLPVDKVDLSGQRIAEPPYPTLYLLHGIFGDQNDWINGTRIARWAMDHNLAVIMPAGENHFYLDQQEDGFEYSRFISEELVELTRLLFPLSDRRDQTFIGGLSMGGWGALINGIRHPETFGAVIALSPAVLDEDYFRRDEQASYFLDRGSYRRSCTGRTWKTLKENEDELMDQLEKTAQSDSRPRVYLACGQDDDLLPQSLRLADSLDRLGYTCTFDLQPGGHEWDFWDSQIHKVVDWLVPEKQAGISSGNVL